jgi:hypothetical protein
MSGFLVGVFNLLFNIHDYRFPVLLGARRRYSHCAYWSFYGTYGKK